MRFRNWIQALVWMHQQRRNQATDLNQAMAVVQTPIDTSDASLFDLRHFPNPADRSLFPIVEPNLVQDGLDLLPRDEHSASLASDLSEDALVEDIETTVPIPVFTDHGDPAPMIESIAPPGGKRSTWKQIMLHTAPLFLGIAVCLGLLVARQRQPLQRAQPTLAPSFAFAIAAVQSELRVLSVEELPIAIIDLDDVVIETSAADLVAQTQAPESNPNMPAADEPDGDPSLRPTVEPSTHVAVVDPE